MLSWKPTPCTLLAPAAKVRASLLVPKKVLLQFGVSILIAVFFLAGALWIEPLPWVVPLAAAGDAAMALAVFLVHRSVTRERPGASQTPPAPGRSPRAT